MNPPDTTQKDNRAGRNIGGRDVHDQHAERDINIYNAGMPTSLGRLIKKLKEETAEDKSLKIYIEELSLFAQPLPAEPIQGLESKLLAADRSDELYDALALKEMIYERLKANIASPTFQQIYAYLLGLTKDRFATYVRHLIQEGATRPAVDQAIFEQVVEPIREELESCGEAHNFTPQTLRGLIYFLAGNCHIRWH